MPSYRPVLRRVNPSQFAHVPPSRPHGQQRPQHALYIRPSALPRTEDLRLMRYSVLLATSNGRRVAFYKLYCERNPSTRLSRSPVRIALRTPHLSSFNAGFLTISLSNSFCVDDANHIHEADGSPIRFFSDKLVTSGRRGALHGITAPLVWPRSPTAPSIHSPSRSLQGSM